MGQYKAIINPFTGTLQLVPSNIAIAFKEGVATQANLPLTGNTKGDARITNDNGHLYIWSIIESSGLLTDWSDEGDIIDLEWAAISGKPSSSVADIDDAVTKKHIQGTDLVPINEQIDDYTLVIEDLGKLIDMNKGIAVTLTIPKNSSVPFPIGTTILVRQKGLGEVTIVPIDGDVTIDSSDGLNTTGQYTVASLLKIDTDVWTAVGVGAIDWSIIANKPESSIEDIDDAVSKKHTQGTDQGLDTGGVSETSAIEIRDSADKKHSPSILGTKEIDETEIGDDKAIVFDTVSDKLKYASVLPAPSTEGFTFQITTVGASDTFELPINGGGAGYTQNFTVYWGDGTDSTITSYDDAERIHTYADEGTYDIRIDGICEWFYYNGYEGDCALIKKVLGLTYDLGFKKLNFNTCTNLNYVDSSIENAASLVDGANFFGFNYSLTNPPVSLFRKSTQLTTASRLFYMAGASFIPPDIFKNLPLLNKVEYLIVFSGVNFIPPHLFDNNPLLNNLNYAFQYGYNTKLPADLFKYNSLITNFYGTFWGNRTTSIPVDFFKYNPLITNFGWTFSGCPNLTSIPTNIFDYNTEVTTVASLFLANPQINQALDGNMFLYNTKIENFSDCFKNCSGLTGSGWQTIIANAEAQPVPPTNTAGCFSGCTGLTGYPASIPTAWGGTA